jgi:DNA replication protein DnaC
MLSNHTAEKYADEATAAEPGFLCGVFDDELEWREGSRRERLPERARFPVPKSFEGYDWSHVRIPDELDRASLESASFVRGGQNLVPCGGVGNGKTHMAIACGVAACRAGLPVMFSTVSDLVMRMSAEGGVERTLGEVERADLVILDELGYLPIDQAGARLLFQVVSRCYERRSMIVTTNLEFSRWGSVLTDDQMAAATVDRIIHYGHLLVFDGPTRRMQESPMRAAARKREN